MVTTTPNPCWPKITTTPEAYLVWWDASDPDKKKVSVINNGKVGDTMQSRTTTTEKAVHGGLAVSGLEGAPKRNFQKSWSSGGKHVRKFSANTRVDVHSSTLIAWLPQAACLGTVAAFLLLLVILRRRLFQKPERHGDTGFLLELEGGVNDLVDEEATQTLLQHQDVWHTATAARAIHGCT